MIVEVIAVGTELLLGQIVNSNGAEIAQRLAAVGFDSHYQVVVGDNLARLVATLQVAVDRSHAVVITGGIGPTQDDLTKEALCVLTGRKMVRDRDHAAWIQARIRAQGREPAPNALRMADLPDGADPLPNGTGVALGVAVEHDDTWLFAMPGVPSEMIAMLEGEVVPRLLHSSEDSAVLRSRVLKCWGVGESAVADRLDDLYDSANPSIAYMIKDMEVHVRVTAKAATARETADLIDSMEGEIRHRLGEIVFATDEVTVEELVIERALAAGWTVSTLERATQGRIGARLDVADPRGDVFSGTVVPGSNTALTPRGDVMVEVGPVPPDRAEGATASIDISVATPVGRISSTYAFGGDDDSIRRFATTAGLHLLRISLEEGARR